METIDETLSCVVAFAWLLAGAALRRDRCARRRHRHVDATRPTSPSVRAKIKAKDFKAALAELTPLLETHQHADVYNLMGFSLRKTGDYKQAYTFYRKALDFDPEHKGALEYLGELYVETGQIDKAKENVALLKKLCPQRLRGARRSRAGDRRRCAEGELRRADVVSQLEAAARSPAASCLRRCSCTRPEPSSPAMPAAVAYMQAFGVPGQLLPFAIAVELGGGLSDPARLSDPRSPRCCSRASAWRPRFCSTPSSAIATSSCISRRTWRSRAASSCCSRTAPAPGLSTRCGARPDAADRQPARRSSAVAAARPDIANENALVGDPGVLVLDDRLRRQRRADASKGRARASRPCRWP